ncbi:hypothetical protein EPI10_014761 [Gossypium australe]|uniref:Uncharacterized protein n=1 Tax=Gossypium australe TaxID=47621 RepID=A0A5B6VIB4_9ROSI|nr:hypothetical protein EPI10_014761 [Gossypium australe]
MGIVKFDDAPIVGNLLPNHIDNGVNAIIESAGKRIKLNVTKIGTPLREVWKTMVERGLIIQDVGGKSQEAGNYCKFHEEEDHEIQKCTKFRALVQGLINNKELEFFEFIKEEDMRTVGGESVMKGAEVKWGSMTFPHIFKAFISEGIIPLKLVMTREGMAKDIMKTLSINAIFEEGSNEGNLGGIRPYEPGSVLNN